MANKKWTRPQLTIIRRGNQEAVLFCCKTATTHGPAAGTCAQRDMAGTCRAVENS